MKNNLLVSQGLWLLLPAFADGVAQQYRMFYKKDWWDEIRNTLSDQTDLPYGGKYDELISFLDISSCIKLVDRNWNTDGGLPVEDLKIAVFGDDAEITDITDEMLEEVKRFAAFLKTQHSGNLR